MTNWVFYDVKYEKKNLFTVVKLFIIQNIVACWQHLSLFSKLNFKGEEGKGNNTEKSKDPRQLMIPVI